MLLNIITIYTKFLTFYSDLGSKTAVKNKDFFVY